MRIAILSDIHGDTSALDDALSQIDRLGCDRIVCAGDLVDYGPFPNEVCEQLQVRNIPAIRGNHERWALEEGDTTDGTATLRRATLDYLATLPTHLDLQADGLRVAIHHARPFDDMRGIDADEADAADVMGWLTEASADVLIVGHTHRSFCLQTAAGLVVNPGALLRRAHEMFDDTWLYDAASRSYGRGPALGGGVFGVLDLPTTFDVVSARTGEKRPLNRRAL